MPPEFKEWKERVSAAVARRKAALEAAAAQTQATAQFPPASTGPSAHGSGTSRPKADSKKASAPSGYVEKEVAPPVVYASKEEALAAFNAMLDDMAVSSTMKFKDVQDMCSRDDGRWNALRSVGERKQALAEYQTKKMKIEKEEKKVQTRKARDAFFQLLAERVEIDARSRWRECSQLLMEDRRFKEVDNERDREDYFNDFVGELAKKEKDDREKNIAEAKTEFHAVLSNLLDKGTISTRDKWSDVKSNLVELLENARFAALDETDKRRIFQDYMDDKESAIRMEERKNREATIALLEQKKLDFKNFLSSSLDSATIEMDMRWSDAKTLICEHETFKALVDFLEGIKDSSLVRGSEPRDIFDKLVADLREEARTDKRVIRDILDQEHIVIDHNSGFEAVKIILDGLLSQHKMTGNLSKDKDWSVLDAILTSRITSLRKVFDEIQAVKIKEYEEEQRIKQKREDRYLDLLDDYYYRSDHVGVEWEDAKEELERHSAYRDLGRSERKKLFEAHMDELRGKLKGKLKQQASSSSSKLAADSNDREELNSELKRKASVADLPGERDGEDTSKKKSRSSREKPDRSDRDRDEDEDKTNKKSERDTEREKDKEKGKDRDKDRDRDRDKDRDRDRESMNEKDETSSGGRKRSHRERDDDRDGRAPTVAGESHRGADGNTDEGSGRGRRDAVDEDREQDKHGRGDRHSKSSRDKKDKERNGDRDKDREKEKDKDRDKDRDRDRDKDRKHHRHKVGRHVSA